jgi:hypothetical protein
MLKRQAREQRDTDVDIEVESARAMGQQESLAHFRKPGEQHRPNPSHDLPKSAPP